MESRLERILLPDGIGNGLHSPTGQYMWLLMPKLRYILKLA
jgi:hypothetical protein